MFTIQLKANNVMDTPTNGQSNRLIAVRGLEKKYHPTYRFYVEHV